MATLDLQTSKSMKHAVILMILFQDEMNIYYDNKDDWFSWYNWITEKKSIDIASNILLLELDPIPIETDGGFEKLITKSIVIICGLSVFHKIKDLQRNKIIIGLNVYYSRT